MDVIAHGVSSWCADGGGDQDELDVAPRAFLSAHNDLKRDDTSIVARCVGYLTLHQLGSRESAPGPAHAGRRSPSARHYCCRDSAEMRLTFFALTSRSGFALKRNCVCLGLLIDLARILHAMMMQCHLIYLGGPLVIITDEVMTTGSDAICDDEGSCIRDTAARVRLRCRSRSISNGCDWDCICIRIGIDAIGAVFVCTTVPSSNRITVAWASIYVAIGGASVSTTPSASASAATPALGIPAALPLLVPLYVLVALSLFPSWGWRGGFGLGKV